ncbi:MAG: FKBP-type peptidyl-prolyl cis-trans isomerase [Blautia sp.]
MTSEQEISYTLDDNTEYFETDRAAQNGDMVNITYSSTMNGEAFDGGSGEDMDIELGAGYLEGDILQDAESEIIGMKADDTKEMDLTIPEDYYFDDSLAGQKIHVTLTVNSVSEIERPELTDEFVASISDFDTVDAYKEDLKKPGGFG